MEGPLGQTDTLHELSYPLDLSLYGIVSGIGTAGALVSGHVNAQQVLVLGQELSHRQPHVLVSRKAVEHENSGAARTRLPSVGVTEPVASVLRVDNLQAQPPTPVPVVDMDDSSRPHVE